VGRVAKGRQLVRFGSGELHSIHPLFSEERYAAWPHYLRAAARIEPAVIVSLLSEEGFDAFRETQENRETWVHKAEWSNLPVPPGPDDPLERFILAWCQRWGMIEWYAKVPARNLLTNARRRRANGEPEPQTFTCDCNGTPFDPGEWRPLHGASFFLGDVQISGIGSGERLSIDLPGLAWNPLQETCAAALTRIMATIEPIVASVLDDVQHAYIDDGYKPVESGDATRRFEWLARYQLLRERKREIARSEALEERHIRRTLIATAKLLGIELRVERRGRPPRRVARTVKFRK